MSLLDRPAVRRVRDALAAAGSDAPVIELEATARSAADAAAALGCPLGAIVKSLVFTLDGAPVLALVAGDRRCDAAALPAAFGRPGAAVGRADANRVRVATGFSIGGVAPLGHPAPLPTVLDPSLGRFKTVHAAAGHPYCVFATSLDELLRLTGGTVAPSIAPA